MDINVIPSGQNITLGSGHDWHYFANLDKETIRTRWSMPTGKDILQSLKAAGFTKLAIESRVGKFADKYDLRGIPLIGEFSAPLIHHKGIHVQADIAFVRGDRRS